MRSLAVRTATAVAVATVALLAGCGGEDEPVAAPETGSSESSDGPSEPSSSEPAGRAGRSQSPGAPDGVEEARTVAREAFCSELDPEAIAAALGLDDVQVLVDEGSTPEAPRWACTIGQSSGSSVGVTWTLHDRNARAADIRATLDTQLAALGADNCEAVADTALGAGTQGVDCDRGGSGSDAASMGFAAVSRAAVVDDTLLECFLASTSADDLSRLTTAAPAVCGMLLDAAES